MTATTKSTPLPLRNDTILGVCEALGQDLRINATLLRLAFIAPLFFQPMLTVGVYLALGAVVAASRYFYPRVAVEAPVLVADNPPAPVATADSEEQLQIAA